MSFKTTTKFCMFCISLWIASALTFLKDAGNKKLNFNSEREYYHSFEHVSNTIANMNYNQNVQVEAERGNIVVPW